MVDAARLAVRERLRPHRSGAGVRLRGRDQRLVPIGPGRKGPTQPEERSEHGRSIRGYTKLLEADPERARGKPRRITLNTYLKLRTRGLKGCYVSCVDEEMQGYLKGLRARGIRSRAGRESAPPSPSSIFSRPNHTRIRGGLKSVSGDTFPLVLDIENGLLQHPKSRFDDYLRSASHGGFRQTMKVPSAEERMHASILRKTQGRSRHARESAQT